MNDRFLFVDPPSPPGFVSFKQSHGGYGEFCRESRLRVPTLDIFHAASLLLEQGFEAGVLDSVLLGHSPEECAAEIARRRPSWVVFRSASASLPHDLRVAEAAREVCAARVVFYGPWLSVEPETALASPAVDAVVLGEAPPILLELARRGSAEGVAGVWRKHGARRVKEKPAPLLEDLDLLPIPRWDLVDYERYSYVTAQTSWGCPLGCGYCPYPVTQGTRQRARSAAGVAREFSTLRERYQRRFVLLRDPEFTLNRRRTEELCEALIAAGTPIAWGCETRLDTLDEELASLMARAGCLRVSFGVESLNPEALKRMGRPSLGREGLRKKVAMLKSRGMLAYALYLIGLPGETRDSIRETIDFALGLGTEAASFSMATPFPGTNLERLARRRGWIAAPDPRRLTSSVPSMRNEALSAGEIEELYLEAKKRWARRKDARPAAR